MADIKSILDFKSRTVSDIIQDLRDKSVSVPDWCKLEKDYDPAQHEICTDTTTLKDKQRSDGTTEPSSRISIGLEKLLCRRMSEFTFTIPVKRVYSNVTKEDGSPNEVRQAIIKAMEAIYKNARIEAWISRLCSLRSVHYMVHGEET